MKTLSYVLLTLISVITLSCERGDGPDGLDRTALLGKWRLSESLADPGDGSGRWKPVDEEYSKKIVEFKRNGKLGGTAFGDLNQYVIKDSVTITFLKANKKEQEYWYSIKDDTLAMGPTWPTHCLEPCGMRFVKVK
ncbi:hypothetical protein BDE36_1088 [Arcticibacter tournemirensis]|uniref:Lipocalin-like domain-containing protein n=1 Tax=Arcticibacter tournemirensis TaxID=699437 RepID=A0A5M9HN72_9SPHI|nr:hypothetical protein [Arcticibacter tournemirensis]KAA8486838.1 hypothetical protein F1649_01090 [Arcticibacter tournemirensis]TQM49386.1 hypothetical protein BDE36_1088 [Arcticibacter tournemirensis]